MEERRSVRLDYKETIEILWFGKVDGKILWKYLSHCCRFSLSLHLERVLNWNYGGILIGWLFIWCACYFRNSSLISSLLHPLPLPSIPIAADHREGAYTVMAALFFVIDEAAAAASAACLCSYWWCPYAVDTIQRKKCQWPIIVHLNGFSAHNTLHSSSNPWRRYIQYFCSAVFAPLQPLSFSLIRRSRSRSILSPRCQLIRRLIPIDDRPGAG